MSFWDALKPAQRAAQPTAVDLSSDQQMLTVTWDDGQVTPIGARTLRQYCPCAACVEEWTRKRTFEVESIARDMKVLEVSTVGNYAVTFVFGDAHQTGIYDFKTLRELATAHPAPAAGA